MQADKHAVISILRDKILSGELKAGERLAEIPTAESLGVSRTPIRIAFRTLEQEGLLTKLPRRGYKVRRVTARELTGAVEVRGVLEGLAARLAAEIGVSESILVTLKSCLDEGDEVFATDVFNEQCVQKFVKMNNRFHAAIVEASQNDAIASALQLNEYLPMASVSAIVFNPADAEREFKRLQYAHQQHYAVVDAIIHRQGARAEALMKEHAHAALNRYGHLNDFSDVKVVRMMSPTP